MKSSKICEGRLKNVLLQDKTQVSPEFLNVLKSDLFALFSDYMAIDEDSLSLRMEVAEDGYHFYVGAKTNRIKQINVL